MKLISLLKFQNRRLETRILFFFHDLTLYSHSKHNFRAKVLCSFFNNLSSRSKFEREVSWIVLVSCCEFDRERVSNYSIPLGSIRALSPRAVITTRTRPSSKRNRVHYCIHTRWFTFRSVTGCADRETSPWLEHWVTTRGSWGHGSGGNDAWHHKLSSLGIGFEID